jgi:hypothetical protein
MGGRGPISKPVAAINHRGNNSSTFPGHGYNVLTIFQWQPSLAFVGPAGE